MFQYWCCIWFDTIKPIFWCVSFPSYRTSRWSDSDSESIASALADGIGERWVANIEYLILGQLRVMQALGLTLVLRLVQKELDLRSTGVLRILYQLLKQQTPIWLPSNSWDYTSGKELPSETERLLECYSNFLIDNSSLSSSLIWRDLPLYEYSNFFQVRYIFPRI